MPASRMPLSSHPDTASSQPSPHMAARLWTRVGNFAFLVATAYAIAVVMFRLPTDWFDNGRAFRIALALHVELAVFFWLMSTLAAQWAQASHQRRPSARLAARLGATGTIVTAVSPIAGGSPVMADYFPWLSGNPVFAIGFGTFCLGILWAAITAAREYLSGRECAPWQGVGISSLATISAAAAAFTTWIAGGDNLQDLSWAAGHTLLFAHVAALSWELPRLIGPAARQKNYPTVLLAVIAICLTLIPLVARPGTPEFHSAFTQSMSWLLWPPLLTAVWAGWRRRQAPETLPSAAKTGFWIAFALLLAGLSLGTLIDGATTLVTAHYHAAVGAVVITRMATTYRFAPELAARVVPQGSSVRQLVTYACGLALLSSGLALASIDHAPRKTSATETVHKGPYFRAGMMLSGLGGLFAMAGSLWLVNNLAGRRRTRASSCPVEPPILHRKVNCQADGGECGRSKQPGNGPVIVK